jgi:hypothetical protein
MRKIIIGVSALALGVAFVSGPAFAQSQTYPFTIASPAFGPGVPGANPPAARSARRSYARSAYAYERYERVPDVSQIYPMTIASPAFGPGVPSGSR